MIYEHASIITGRRHPATEVASNSQYEHVAARRSPWHRPPGQVWFLPKQSPNNRGLLRREEQEPSSQRHNENCCEVAATSAKSTLRQAQCTAFVDNPKPEIVMSLQ